VSHVILALLFFVAFHEFHASYLIGPNTTEFEGMPSFTDANLSPSFDQGKHHVSSMNRISHYNIYIMLLIVHLSIVF
jgi:hypothetical protein